MRIVAGKFKGRKLAKSDHLKDLRPTTDRNREALFNILTSGRVVNEAGFNLIDANILDVCCGSGAVAFEALSRGAKLATLIDNNLDHLEIAKKTARDFGIKNEAKILCLDVRKLPENKEFFDLEYRKHKHHLSSSKALAELTPRQHSGAGFPPKSSHRHKNRPSCH